ncbi:4Fe-4S dicluster domain-containing protein [Pseudovibrio sp. Tun.PSC04-5.I4]|uniref:4Fe-4S dicluster domain-containing protein n=1 Tax=Pseudovibrio sp. Tun.PSC04-5.I4 TaxID=1798213 RepID=UPI00088789F4|nr:4Fe-4S dicluster domain-containing protein [Pseudovibrio sp. Tun.PSC04-5.I4]SDQ12169.1 4Fe-4S dicluster domain-containing protein [Pseudovibrio sp. Tun.PSC04-5.I4]
MGFLKKIISNLLKPPRTEAFPFAPPQTPASYRGKVVVTAEKCVGCSTCARVCVSSAIDLVEEKDGIALTIWHSKCTFCGLCAYYCPTDAMTVTNEWDLSHRNEQKFAIADTIVAKYQVCVDCGEALMVPHGGVISSSIIGHERLNQKDAPRCNKCRRVQKARQIAGVRI